jgi:hypothetical protein
MQRKDLPQRTAAVVFLLLLLAFGSTEWLGDSGAVESVQDLGHPDVPELVSELDGARPPGKVKRTRVRCPAARACACADAPPPRHNKRRCALSP